MKALQSRVRQLEEENLMLKDVFNGVQQKCVEMEKSHYESVREEQEKENKIMEVETRVQEREEKIK